MRTPKPVPIQVDTCSLRYVERKLEINAGCCGGYDALLSISGSTGGGWPDVAKLVRTIRLAFDDVPGDTQRRGRKPATKNDVATIINMGRCLHGSQRLLVHCRAGRSRSTAAAMILYRAYGYRDRHAVGAVLEQNPKATPNGWLLTLADELMGSQLVKRAQDKCPVKCL